MTQVRISVACRMLPVIRISFEAYPDKSGYHKRHVFITQTQDRPFALQYCYAALSPASSLQPRLLFAECLP